MECVSNFPKRTFAGKANDSPVIALAGNPNVGKSTLFNALTGARQHTGNWPGKTVATAEGRCVYENTEYHFIDLPGTYSLMAHSAEEEVARDFIVSGSPDAVIVVCDATCLERNMNLVLQTMEITPWVLVCVNLMDEAKRKSIQVDTQALERRLGVPVVGASAGQGRGLDELMLRLSCLVRQNTPPTPLSVLYPTPVEEAARLLESAVTKRLGQVQNSRYIALRLLDKTLPPALRDAFSADLEADRFLAEEMDAAWRNLDAGGITPELLADDIVTGLVRTAEEIAGTVVHSRKKDTSLRDRRLDRLFASRLTGIPIMLFMLALILWITLSGANYPSDLLSRLLFRLQDGISQWFLAIGAPEWLRGILVSGAFRVLCWVVSVMLPPMAIFFPLFTLLEQFGYLPRVAFNLDHAFQKAKTCGKQALTMCMGFGCNAVGVTGCRIIDSPRERLIAMLTNNFVPCNGRFPTLIAIITMFCVGTAGAIQQIYAVLLLTAVLVFGILMTFLVSRALSATLLKGIPSSFTLELPPYRRPRIGQVLVRSVLDRTLFVLGRAAVIAAPAGAVIWLLANTSVGDLSLLSQCTHFLDPFAKLLGLDGVILTAFILGFPANEIVIPIIIMSYLSTGSLQDPGSLEALRTLFVNNGWTLTTAVCTMLFSLMHWPCSTTCFTIWKESRSVKWTLISIALPTILGMFFCFLVASGGRLIQSFF